MIIIILLLLSFSPTLLPISLAARSLFTYIHDPLMESLRLADADHCPDRMVIDDGFHR